MNNNLDALTIRHDAEEIAALFPALLVEAERIAQTVAAGLHGRRRAGPGETFWQHRPYAFGDPVSAIDWRQSARVSDRLYIRQNEWEAAAAVYLWCDPSRSMAYSSSKNWPEKIARARVIAVALSILLSQAGERVAILGEGRRPYQGRTTPSRILEALLSDPANASTPPPSHPPSGARIVMLGDFYSDAEAIERAVGSLAAGGAHGALIQIVDPAEENFPFEGRVEFRDLESTDRLTFGETGSLRASYRQQFEAHRNRIETLARKTGWRFFTHRTDKPPQTALLSLFTALGDQRLWS